jgi:hypothetical protein
MKIILGKIIFERILFAGLIRYATYMHFYVGKILSLQKAVLQTLPPLRGISPSRFRKRSEIIRDNLI